MNYGNDKSLTVFEKHHTIKLIYERKMKDGKFTLSNNNVYRWYENEFKFHNADSSEYVRYDVSISLVRILLPRTGRKVSVGSFYSGQIRD